jgi:hypothetical protein
MSTDPSFDQAFEGAFPGNTWNESQVASLRPHWERPDDDFFRAGACHILAHVFLETYPDAGFRPFLICPVDYGSGFHVFVARETIAFDYQGYSSRSALIHEFEERQMRKTSGWQYELIELPMPVVTTSFCERYQHRNFTEYYADPRPRAQRYVARFPQPAPLA